MLPFACCMAAGFSSVINPFFFGFPAESHKVRLIRNKRRKRRRRRENIYKMMSERDGEKLEKEVQE